MRQAELAEVTGNIARRDKKGRTLLAIQFFHRGKCWRTDTPEEAIRLRQRLEAEDPLKVGPDDRRVDGVDGL